jgi:predicted ribosomally synthesized peptide with nif11-like leader
MSVEDAKKFLKNLDQDPGFKKRLQNVTQDEVKKILHDQGLQFTQNELIEAYGQIKGRELETEELAQIAAGVVPGTSVSAPAVEQ